MRCHACTKKAKEVARATVKTEVEMTVYMMIIKSTQALKVATHFSEC
jgi:hypothetical protein